MLTTARTRTRAHARVREGDRFVRLTALVRIRMAGKVPRYGWLCRCDCGSHICVREDNLLTGNSRSCGCLVMARQIEKYVTGRREKNLTIIAIEGVDEKGELLLRCWCHLCNGEVVVSHLQFDMAIRSNRNTACGKHHGHHMKGRGQINLTGMP